MMTGWWNWKINTEEKSNQRNKEEWVWNETQCQRLDCCWSLSFSLTEAEWIYEWQTGGRRQRGNMNEAESSDLPSSRWSSRWSSRSRIMLVLYFRQRDWKCDRTGRTSMMDDPAPANVLQKQQRLDAAAGSVCACVCVCVWRRRDINHRRNLISTLIVLVL